MPIKIPDNLPAYNILQNENIFVMSEERAYKQEIRPLKIAILNLMPTKIVTETQLLRLLGNSPLQVEVDFLHPKSHVSKNTPQEHLDSFYKTFEEVEHNKYDGLIITGAPIETLEFEEVTYWDELKMIMEWSKHNVYSTLHICWAAQAGLYYHYGIKKYLMKNKLSGVFVHRKTKKNMKILRGFDDIFYVPHSRHTYIKKEDIERASELDILAESKEAGIYLVKSKGGRQVFATGHSEYDPCTLQIEYERDVKKGIDVVVPRNYFPDDVYGENPIVKWRGHGNLLFANWLNYYVYQETPYNIQEID